MDVSLCSLSVVLVYFPFTIMVTSAVSIIIKVGSGLG